MAALPELNWNDLRCFLQLVQGPRSLAGAARVLGMDHSTLGRRLSALERALGAPLLLRGPDGLRLTPLGEELAPLVEQVGQAVQALRERAAQRSLRVRLALPSGFTRLFTERLAELRAARPELSLELISGARPIDLARGEADLALRSGPVGEPDLVARRVGSSGWSLYAAPAYLARHGSPADPEQLAGHLLIGFDASLAAVPAARWVEAHAAPGAIVLRNREMTDMLASALSGVGLALLPCLLGDAERGLVRLTPRVLATRELWLTCRPELRASPAVQAVMGWVAEVLRERRDLIAGQPAEGS